MAEKAKMGIIPWFNARTSLSPGPVIFRHQKGISCDPLPVAKPARTGKEPFGLENTIEDCIPRLSGISHRS
ncbi:MAG: hypothetical protein JWM59_1948 [Verrucomicrobiales bacterium]|nr:hypothetical protein [Verrucomicrobiales bacterium]